MSIDGNGEERVRLLDIQDEMRTSYLTYAMSVIVSRALPDVRDGLKPSQRRILVAMHDLSLSPGSARTKCSKIVGEAMGNYHPHGDQAIYPTLVRLAQKWMMREVLIDKQGNFGSLAGLPPAAMRYTEARLSYVASEMLDDLEGKTAASVAERAGVTDFMVGAGAAAPGSGGESDGSDQQGGQREQAVAQQGIEQVVAIIAPEGHLPLAVVHGVQRPPPAPGVLPAVDGVVEQIEHHQVDQEGHQRQVGDARPELVDVGS